MFRLAVLMNALAAPVLSYMLALKGCIHVVKMRFTFTANQNLVAPNKAGSHLTCRDHLLSKFWKEMHISLDQSLDIH